ncbi:hypothetical protein M9H77_28137 [Catharanthus roseus]|uniref:Uncharacterized protein n=1 Tax=Catharanthus roseus TaxID=4058 RepID=A0ACC0AFE8_CATRO|nr:hypothetical protein M9H77_28137 [Catharanthus roseus]
MELPEKFSCLPKELWRYVVSLLSLEDTVRTSALSKDWRKIWYSFPNLIFKYDKFPEIEQKHEKFVEFIKMTLARHDRSNIEAFELHLFSWDDGEILIQREWISFALHHNVKKILLEGDIHESDNIPDCLFRSKSLVVLELVMSKSVLEKMENIFLPNLQELCLRDLMIDEDAIEVLLPSCPSLEYMSIICCDFVSQSLTISSLGLQKLIICQCGSVGYNSLKLQSSMLSELTLVGNIVEEYELMSLPCISFAYVSFWEFLEGEMSTGVIVKSAIKLYKELKNAPQLFLNEWFIEILSRASDITSILETTSASKLRRLTLYIQPNRKHIEIMLHILSKSPNLQELNIIIAKNSDTTVDLVERNYQSERWISSGLLNHLTHVNIHRFVGNEKELEILRLLLKSTPELINLNVLSYNEAKNEEISEKILTQVGFPRCTYRIS